MEDFLYPLFCDKVDSSFRKTARFASSEPPPLNDMVNMVVIW